MFVIVPLAHNNLLIGTATQCYMILLWFPAMNKVAIAGLGVTYIGSTGEHAPATIVGPEEWA